MLTAIVGINWGDEGKGRMVDLLAQQQDFVVRYQGGNNAGHTVVTPAGKFVLNLLPSGILRTDVVSVMGNGMVIDLEHLVNEIGRLRDAGITITPDNLKISDKATICLPVNVTQDNLEEDRLGKGAHGSTRRGIAPAYGDKYMRRALRMEDLLDREQLTSRLKALIDWKELTLVGGYHAPKTTVEEMLHWLDEFGKPLLPFICDVGPLLSKATDADKRIMFEAQLGALRDIDFGIYPYTSSSSVLAAYGPIGAGIPGYRVDHVLGIMKAYSSSVGGGPFVAEWFGHEADALREAGGEYGAATGRPRRVGPFDVVASRYGVKVQGADSIALTKMDILSYMETIPVCTAYEIDGKRIEDFPTGLRLERAVPIIEHVPGWQCDIEGCRKKEDLPQAALDYIVTIEKAVACPVEYVSVGAARDAYIKMF